MRDITEALEQEAEFWRTMLKEYPDAGASEHHRMCDALMLAEYKLAQMTDSLH